MQKRNRYLITLVLAVLTAVPLSKWMMATWMSDWLNFNMTPPAKSSDIAAYLSVPLVTTIILWFLYYQGSLIVHSWIISRRKRSR